MNNLIFWIIVCSWLIPMGIRMYNRSRQRRMQDRGFPGQNYPGQQFPPQQFPGQQFPPQQFPGQGFPQQQFPNQQYPGQPYPPQNLPGQYPVIIPGEPQPPAGAAYDGAGAPPSSTAPLPSPTPGAEPQGYRARKLAELDAQFSNGEIAMEEYMKRRAEITNG
ncbi:hypothetical protein [Arthrobacter sp. CJ23]|uniref:hypothetical protein n=1 Tax=Arthrobacter sp. CJ23 TaxID=2972479 RepID=UPI00215C5ED1|nr:hypothetical protein [Arthrobacter sp. CJ23]UVJ40830.1 hypothetical protein NVV90_06575 [Arthrobacter sp. CJ23]